MSKTTLLLWILTSALAFSQSSTLSPAAASSSVNLPAHETLHYTVEWRLITAGKARLELMPVTAPKPGYQVGLHLESSGLVSKLFKVEDDYLSNLNQNFCAQSLQMTSHEGNRQRETKVTFDTEAKRAAYLERDKVKNSTVLQQEIDIPPCVHDVIGGIYQMRTLQPRARAGYPNPGQRRKESRDGPHRSAAARGRQNPRRYLQNHPLRNIPVQRHPL